VQNSFIVTYQDQQYQLFNQLETVFKKGQQPSNVYPPIADYARDSRQCLTLVNYTSPDLSKLIDAQLIQPLKEADSKQYFYPQISLHTTLLTLFLAADPPLFTEAEIKIIAEILTETFKKITPITYCLDGLFIMPNSIGIRGYTDSKLTETIHLIQQDLAAQNIKLSPGLASNEVFFGHITICRFTTQPNSEFWQKLTELKNIKLGSYVSNSWNLVSSNLAFEPNSTKTHQVFNLDDHGV